MSNESIATCPHCGNKTSHVVTSQTSSREKVYDTNGEFIGEFDNYFYLTACKTCNEICLFSDWELSDNPGNLNEAVPFYPYKRKLAEAVPKEIRKSYEEAKKVEKISPNAFAVLTRRSLELLCKDQKAKGNNLKEQISDLSAKGNIPSTLIEMADTLRFLGNIGAHEIEFDFEKSETQAMDDFLVAMLEYVYVAPNKIRNLLDSISKKSKK